MKIAVTGSSGLIGSALVASLRSAGHDVLCLVRSASSPGPASSVWHPERDQIDAAALDGVDAAVNLAGEPLVGRWTTGKQDRIRQSRLQGTQLLCRTLATLPRKPKLIISASAVGYYGSRGDEPLREDSPPGSGFLASVCRQWEEAADPARQQGIRVVHPRLGIVLSARGGALAQSLGPFRFGLGGRLGTGTQYWSWITLDDVVAVFHRFLDDVSLEGPTNVVTPEPVTNRQFTATLGRVLHRPTAMSVPAFALRLALGTMADEVILASARVVPQKLLNAGHTFEHATLEPALRHCLGK